MLICLLLLMLVLLVKSAVVMDAASAACRLFVTAVMPGLLPYLVLVQMAVSRARGLSPFAAMLLGWGGGSPTGARLVSMLPLSRREEVRLAVSCATMSPMFLLGTVGAWLGSPRAGAVVLASVLLSGWLTGNVAVAFVADGEATGGANPSPTGALSFGAAVEASARTMLLVCGTMVMLRVFAALAAEVLPLVLVLPVTALLEVTTGASGIAELPLPLPWRTALIAGATGFGGLAIIMQNRAVYREGFLPLGIQLLWQALHGGVAFLLALGGMGMCCPSHFP